MRPPRLSTIMILLVIFATFSSATLPPSARAEEDQNANQAGSAATKATADAEPKIPPGPKVYKGREIAKTMHFAGAPWLVRESREREEECSTLLKVLNVQPGQVICDMGAGNGFYSLQMAEQLQGKGQILAVDIQPEMLRLLQARAAEANITCGKVVINPPADRVYEEKLIVPIIGSYVDPYLPDGKVDLCVCVDVYHEFSHPEQMLAAIRKSLSPKGRLVLVEFRTEDPKVPIKPLHKMSKEQILKELVPNGFKLVEQFDELPWQHVMFFQRDDDWQPPAK